MQYEPIQKRKAELEWAVEEQRKLIQLFDNPHLSSGSRASAELDLEIIDLQERYESVDESRIINQSSRLSVPGIVDLKTLESEMGFNEFKEPYEKLENMKEELNRLRLIGDEFRLGTKFQRMIEVTAHGEIIFLDVKRSLDLRIPDDMSKMDYFRLSVIEDPQYDEPIYEQRFPTRIRYIDQVKSIRGIGDDHYPCDDLPTTPRIPTLGGGSASYHNNVIIIWKDDKVEKLDVALRSKELVNVLGCQLKEFNKKKLKQMGYVRSLYKKRNELYDKTNPNHENLLLSFWNVVFPEDPIDDRISPQWKRLGFQGNDPSTDFRGMGILGLEMLVYFAGNYTAQVVEMISSHPEYPFAVSGINITSMIMDLCEMTEEKLKLAAFDPVWSTPFFTFFMLRK